MLPGFLGRRFPPMNALRLIGAVLALALGLAAVAPAAVGDGYVGCSASDSCVPFDPVTYVAGTPIDLLPDGDYPYDATMRPDGTEVWICGAVGDGIVVIKTATNTVSHRIPVGEYLNSIAFTDDSSKALVGSRDEDGVFIVDTATYTTTGFLPVVVGSGGTYDSPGNLALDPVSTNIYAVDWYDDYLFEIAPDGSSVLRSSLIGDSVWQLVVDPEGEYIYVTDRSTDQVRVIDQATLTEIRTVAVGDDPWGIDVTLDGEKLVVACEDDSNVHIIYTADWTTKVIPLPSGADPRDVDILDAEGYAYVACGEVTGADFIAVIELVGDTLKDTFPSVGSNPNVIAVQPQMTSAITGVAEGEVAVRVLRLACSPNPFNPKTTISYHIRAAAEIELAVYDVTGARVTVLERGTREAGDHEIAWDGRTADGTPVATGVYFVRLTADAAQTTAKAVLLK
jgi:YVTN family beta-propeller protein